jgi:hypothetical protein
MPRSLQKSQFCFGSQLAAACVKVISGNMRQHFSPDGFACSIRFKGALSA